MATNIHFFVRSGEGTPIVHTESQLKEVVRRYNLYYKEDKTISMAIFEALKQGMTVRIANENEILLYGYKGNTFAEKLYGDGYDKASRSDDEGLTKVRWSSSK